MIQRSAKRPGRAAAQYAWTGPLLPQLQRYRRLSSASWRMGAIALGSTVMIAVAKARSGYGWSWGLLLGALVIAGVGGLFLGRAAGREAERLREEMDRIEEEARRHLP